MKPPRTALLLPRYVERKPLKGGGWGYLFHVPSWARKAGCAVENSPLGADYAAAVERAEKILLPAFDAWRKRGEAPAGSPAVAKPGTLDWMFAEYRADRRFPLNRSATTRSASSWPVAISSRMARAWASGA
ncbi:hypothetical protein QA641_19495 [Bradyrhizobium sp. CB1650]|uniref:hypothetical protein n=1 Tax=Bradyrhizobium sp. CB1650 TaxID=3039153 RepID=UPI0024348177|nr:hypothetical protein [Bradyrhizobium sp. CB1650]WGD55875.1 hypothetical protein QA641_19495 [Bradyrhizobium sp. CB1650]